MSHRIEHPTFEKPKQSWADRIAEDRTRQLNAALSWVQATDRIIAQGKLSHAGCAVIDACQTVVLMGRTDSYWQVTRALREMAAAGYKLDAAFHSRWLARLEAHTSGQPAQDYGDNTDSAGVTWEPL